MRRREFIVGLGGAATWPLAAWAQQRGEVRRIAVLMDRVATDTIPQSYLAAFTRGLQQFGWTEHDNLRMDVRWTAGDVELARICAAQLIGLMPDVILASTTTNLTVIRQATSTIPVVFVAVADPVAQGFVTSLKEPGGNLTGFSQPDFSIGGKWLELLKEAAPGLMRVAVLFNPDTSPPSKFLMRAVEAAAPTLGIQPIALLVRTTADIERDLESFADQPNSGLMLTADSFTSLRQALIVDLASRYRLPSIAPAPDFAKEGGLITYRSDSLVEQYRRAAGYVDRILKGAKPSELPVQGPTKFRLVINLKTAKTLGLTMSLPLLGLADEVIE
jgi:putative tryptophan/tyrosine transport system substrate-binding protein